MGSNTRAMSEEGMAQLDKLLDSLEWRIMSFLEREQAMAKWDRERPREHKLFKLGGAVVLVLPAASLRFLGWKAGDAVLVSLDGKRLIIE